MSDESSEVTGHDIPEVGDAAVDAEGAFDPLADEFEEDEESAPPVRGRPAGVEILAVLLVLGGLARGVVDFITIDLSSDAAARSAKLLPSDGVAGLVVSLVKAGLIVATGVGLWRTRRWAWWLCNFVMLSGALSVSSLLLLALSSEGKLPAWVPGGSASLTIGAFIRLVIYGGVVLYLFSDRPVEHFGLRPDRKSRYLWILLGCWCVLLAALFGRLALVA